MLVVKGGVALVLPGGAPIGDDSCSNCRCTRRGGAPMVMIGAPGILVLGSCRKKEGGCSQIMMVAEGRGGGGAASNDIEYEDSCIGVGCWHGC